MAKLWYMCVGQKWVLKMLFYKVGNKLKRYSVFFILLLLVSCGGEVPNLITEGDQQIPVDLDKRETIFGTGEGSGIWFNDTEPPSSGGGSGIGVNAFLWRASLDVVSSLPIASADPFGGVIITDWYSPPQAPKERLKLNVFILGRALRADGIRITVFKQVQGPDGTWATAPVTEGTSNKIELSILTRARQFRSEALQ